MSDYTAPTWTKRVCEQCNREYKGCGTQSHCKRRDCGYLGEDSTVTKERLRSSELAQLIAEQEEEMRLARRKKTRRRGGRGASIHGTVLPDQFETRSGHNDVDSSVLNYGKIYRGGWFVMRPEARHVVPWLDPTADSALDHITKSAELALWFG